MENSEREKIIVILSPQNWDHQFISKHHYSVAFKNAGYRVFFVNPENNEAQRWRIRKDEKYGIEIIDYRSLLPYFLKFKLLWLYRKFNGKYLAKKLTKNIPEIDLIIDFGVQRSIETLSVFNAKRHIFFPVDDNEYLKIETRGADAFYSVSTNIIRKFEDKGIRMSFLDHGLAGEFVSKAKERLKSFQLTAPGKSDSKTIRYGYAGNLSIPFLDRATLIAFIESQPSDTTEFHLFGSYDTHTDEMKKFVDTLSARKNVFLHGKLDTPRYSEMLFEMDVLLLCYQPDGKNYHGENSHKLNEYMSTGVPILDLKQNLTAKFEEGISVENIRKAIDNSYDRKVRDLMME